MEINSGLCIGVLTDFRTVKSRLVWPCHEIGMPPLRECGVTGSGDIWTRKSVFLWLGLQSLRDFVSDFVGGFVGDFAWGFLMEALDLSQRGSGPQNCGFQGVCVAAGTPFVV